MRKGPGSALGPNHNEEEDEEEGEEEETSLQQQHVKPRGDGSK